MGKRSRGPWLGVWIPLTGMLYGRGTRRQSIGTRLSRDRRPISTRPNRRKATPETAEIENEAARAEDEAVAGAGGSLSSAELWL